jgi:alanine racemase
VSNTWIELDLNRLRRNISNTRTAVGSETELIFVVKSRAYGHGMIPVALCAAEEGIQWFAVAYVEEARELRKALPSANILVLGVVRPEDVATCIENSLVTVIVDKDHAAMLAAAAGKGPLHCHAKIDTGMGRLGFPWKDAAAALTELASCGGLDICGICTHLAASNDPGKSFSDIQADRFLNVVGQCEKAGLTIPFKHITNSGGLVIDSSWHLQGVRPGILLYGYNAGGPVNIDTSPFLNWKTRVVQVKTVEANTPIGYDCTFSTERKTCIGVIDVGYADGYPRSLSNRGEVLIGGRRVPVVGRVSMNLVTVDLGPDTSVERDAEVVLLGSQGAETISAEELANWCGTVHYEILTGIQSRVTQEPV